MSRFTYLGPDGKTYTRPRPRRPCIFVDIDLMDRCQLEAFVKSWPRGVTLTEWGKSILPARPVGFRSVANSLWLMAKFRLEGRDELYERRYQSLPRWAQWRDNINFQAAVLPGKRFRKHVPRTKKGC